MSDIKAEKNALRQQIHLKRNSMNETSKELFDVSICKVLVQLIEERNCKTVHAYLPMGSEINIAPLLQMLLSKELTVVTPKTLKKRKLQHLVLTSLENLESGIYGTSHPANGIEYSGDYDLIIVPGLAFDTNNYRLGYGGGYYDAFLAENPNTFMVGIGYPFQKIKSVPKEAHDARLDLVI